VHQSSQEIRNALPSFTNSRDMTGQNLKKRRLALDVFKLHTKFGDSRSSHFGDMIAGFEIENGLCNPDHALLGVVCHPKATI